MKRTVYVTIRKGEEIRTFQDSRKTRVLYSKIPRVAIATGFTYELLDEPERYGWTMDGWKP